MKQKDMFFNPFRMLSPNLDRQALRMEDLHTKPVSQELAIEEGILMMTSKLIEMTGLLSKAFVSGSTQQMDRCQEMADEIDEQENFLTKTLVSTPAINKEVAKGVMRFPYRLERIGDMLESLLRCCRVKAKRSVPFSDKAHMEMDLLFSMLLNLFTNLREAFTDPNRPLLLDIIEDTRKLYQMVEDFKLAHWDRLEAGICHVEASSLYRDILDSSKISGEYVEKMCASLLDLDQEIG